MRSLSNLVSEGFIWSVGITRPKPGKERIARIYIMSILSLTVLSIAGVFFFLLNRF